MNIRIHGGNIEVTKTLRAHIERRVGLALGRFGEQIGPVEVRFCDTPGANGKVEKECHIIVGLLRSLRVAEADADLYAALDRAADRAARSVARELELQRSTH